MSQVIVSGGAFHDIFPFDPTHRVIPCNPKLPLHISLAKLLRNGSCNHQKLLAVSEFFKLNDSEKTKFEELSSSRPFMWDRISEKLFRQEITPSKEPIEIELVISDADSDDQIHTTDSDRITSNSFSLPSDPRPLRDRDSRLKRECPLSIIDSIKWRRAYPKFSEALSVEIKKSELFDQEDPDKKKVNMFQRFSKTHDICLHLASELHCSRRTFKSCCCVSRCTIIMASEASCNNNNNMYPYNSFCSGVSFATVFQPMYIDKR